MSLKKIFLKLHLFLGLTTGTIVFIVSVTGALYAFEEEFRGLMYKDLMHVEASGSRMSLSELTKEVKKEYPKPGIKNIRISNEPTKSVEFILKNKQSVLVDPYTGKVKGSFNKDTDFLGVVQQIHRSLYLGDVGKTITGTSATIFIFMLLSGIIIWWPRNMSFLKHKLLITKTTSKQKRMYDLHSVLGFYASWILIFMALTGIVFSFKWAENTMYWLNGSEKKKEKYRSEYKEDLKRISVDEVIAKSNYLYKKCDDCFISLPEDSVGVYRIGFRYDDGGFYKRSDNLFYDQYKGTLIKAALFETNSQGEKLRMTNYDIHTGKVFGIVGQFLAFFAALISASLPVTGFIMWNRKRKAKKGSRS